jgi:hypothetical protein
MSRRRAKWMSHTASGLPHDKQITGKANAEATGRLNQVGYHLGMLDASVIAKYRYEIENSTISADAKNF